MAVMIDVESWQGQIAADQSDGLNKSYQAIADWLDDKRRVIAYGNRGDLNSLWPSKPVGLRIVLASYGSNPGYPGKIAHQYTNGEGYGGGLPEGCPPFGNCCMDSADGLTAEQYAAACGIAKTTPQAADAKKRPTKRARPQAKPAKAGSSKAAGSGRRRQPA
jgi:hypothetical protein